MLNEKTVHVLNKLKLVGVLEEKQLRYRVLKVLLMEIAYKTFQNLAFLFSKWTCFNQILVLCIL